VSTAAPELPGAVRSRLSRERDDLLLLALALAAVPLGWLAVGWRWPLCVSGYDAWATALPLLQALGAAGGDWHALAYRPDLLGGTRLRDAVGPNPLVALLARTGLHATGVYDAAAFALQALIGFLGARTADDLAHTWSGGRARPAGEVWALRLAALLLSAFAPFLGWRLGYGHLAMTTGLLPFAAALALTAAAAARRLGVTLAVVAALATADGLLFTGHQLLVYGAVFGAPLLAGPWLSGRAPARALAAPALALAAGLLLALPALLGVLAHGLGSDSPRSPAGMQITYSYLTARPLDWISSIPWTRAAIPGWRPPLHHHESNVPLGPLLALLALAPWRRLRPLAWTGGAAAALVLAFSMDLRPLSTLLIAAIPPLGSFRVPTRAALPLMLALPPLAAAAAFHAVGEARPGGAAKTWLLGAAGGAALFMLPPLPRELLGWSAAVLLVWFHRKRPAGGAGLALAALLALAGGTLGAFRERLLTPFRDTEGLLAQARALGTAVAAAHPDLRQPLVRIALAAEVKELGANTAFASGLSSLDGYFFPSRRLIALVAALRGQPYQPSAFVLRMRPAERASQALFPLYNVRWLGRNGTASDAPSVPEGVPPFAARTTGPVDLTPLGPTPGAAWFSQRVEVVPSVESLAATLYGAGDALHERVRSTLWVIGTDEAARALPPAGAACVDAAVNAVEASRTGDFGLDVRATADCPLTLAANYAESLEARVRRGDAWEPARTFPAYGALLGVWVPAGTTRVAVAPR
jgi:hypothetical protein